MRVPAGASAPRAGEEKTGSTKGDASGPMHSPHATNEKDNGEPCPDAAIIIDINGAN